jgi:hypothetical protein
VITSLDGVHAQEQVVVEVQDAGNTFHPGSDTDDDVELESGKAHTSFQAVDEPSPVQLMKKARDMPFTTSLQQLKRKDSIRRAVELLLQSTDPEAQMMVAEASLVSSHLTYSY